MKPETTTIIINLEPGHTDFQALAMKEAIAKFMVKSSIGGTIGISNNTPIKEAS